eukprot:TRINITY_DN2098_c0_g1_i1.p2 TRINITY_DN2098_c0_g1~~TRINITY_DN2098_c0_g1_i1.p2  ORF type:complete len:274 (+),score=21.31 TRINITY_DN2098_c0_g1_i1:118-822(+)
MADIPKTVEQIHTDYRQRRGGILRALTEQQEQLFAKCDPQSDNLCLYGESDGTWLVDLPAEEVPPELPEPCLGINFARDGMPKADWLALVAIHSDSWLLSVAYFYGAKLGREGRRQLFEKINQEPTLFEIIRGRRTPVLAGQSMQQYPNKRRNIELETKTRTPQGRLLEELDITPQLKGKRAQLFWPDDQYWYNVEVVKLNLKARKISVQYDAGEFEEVNIDEILQEQHMVLLN